MFALRADCPAIPRLIDLFNLGLEHIPTGALNRDDLDWFHGLTSCAGLDGEKHVTV